MTLVHRISVPILANSARTAVAGVISYWIAGLFRLPEAYWATITTLVVMQSTLGSSAEDFRRATCRYGTWAHSWARCLAKYFPINVPIFGLGVFALGIVCAALNLGNAYRMAARDARGNHAGWKDLCHTLNRVSSFH